MSAEIHLELFFPTPNVVASRTGFNLVLEPNLHVVFPKEASTSLVQALVVDDLRPKTVSSL
jgi:hypothetical protein